MTSVTFYRDERLPFLEAKIYHAEGIAYHKHFHDEYSIGLIGQGATHAWCDGTKLRVEAGRVISFAPQMLHACRPDAGADWQYTMLYIKPQWLEGLAPHELNRLYIPYLAGEGKNEICGSLIIRTAEALIDKRAPLETETLLIELIQTAANHYNGDLRHMLPKNRDHKYSKLLKDYLHAHYKEPITLDELETVAGISKFHLSRLFKRENHLPLHAYQTLLRINQAKAELAVCRPIADIAAELGFYDQSHFTRTFARTVGATPGKYAASL